MDHAGPHDHFEIPTELWFKIIAFVLADSIYAICCCPNTADASWEKTAFGTLRLVSRLFNDNAVKVADLALTGPRCMHLHGCGLTPKHTHAPGAQDDLMDVDKDDREEHLRLLYNRFKLVNTIQSNRDPNAFFAQSGISLLSAYYGYVQLVKNCKALFSRSALLTGVGGRHHHNSNNNSATAAVTARHLEIVEKVHELFPTAFGNILAMLDFMAVPEMVEKLRTDVVKNWIFIASGLEIIYRCAHVVNRQVEWQVTAVSDELKAYLNELYDSMLANSVLYTSALKERGPGEFPALSELPGVKTAIGLMINYGSYHQPLAELACSWL